MPESEQWVVQHVRMTDDGPPATTQQQSTFNNTMCQVCVSGGSLKLEMGTSAFTTEGDNSHNSVTAEQTIGEQCSRNVWCGTEKSWVPGIGQGETPPIDKGTSGASAHTGPTLCDTSNSMHKHPFH